MKKNIFILLCAFMYAFHGFSQTTTVEELWWGTTGKLTTTIINSDGTRVYHGPYTYIGSRQPSEGFSKGTLSIKANKKNGVTDGNFSLTYLGGHYTGELDFKFAGKVSEKKMIGIWNVKSKCYNKSAELSDNYTWDKSYVLTFNNNGQMIGGTFKDLKYGTELSFQTDSEGYMHGNYSYKYKDDSGQLVIEISEMCHGIEVATYTKNIQTGKLIGEKEVHQDSNIVNDANYLKDEKAFIYNGVKYRVSEPNEYFGYLFEDDNEIGNIWSCLSDAGNCRMCLLEYNLPKGWARMVNQ